MGRRGISGEKDQRPIAWPASGASCWRDRPQRRAGTGPPHSKSFRVRGALRCCFGCTSVALPVRSWANGRTSPPSLAAAFTTTTTTTVPPG
jgi:hypothetical protein